MIVVVKYYNNHIRQGGWYGNHYNDMDIAYPIIFSVFHSASQGRINAIDRRLGTLHGQTDGDRNAGFRRPARSAGTRCLSSLLSRRPLEHGKAVADIGDDTGPIVFSDRHNHIGIGRHIVSSQWQKGQWCWLLARCGSFDFHEKRFRLGIESGGVDFADSTALGRRTVGLADQHEIASQETGQLDRIGRTDDKRNGPMVARKGVSNGCRWVLRQFGRKENFRYNHHFAYPTKRRTLRSAKKTQDKTARAALQERQATCQSRKKWPAMFATGRR